MNLNSRKLLHLDGKPYLLTCVCCLADHPSLLQALSCPFRDGIFHLVSIRDLDCIISLSVFQGTIFYSKIYSVVSEQLQLMAVGYSLHAKKYIHLFS